MWICINSLDQAVRLVDNKNGHGILIYSARVKRSSQFDSLLQREANPSNSQIFIDFGRQN